MIIRRSLLLLLLIAMHLSAGEWQPEAALNLPRSGAAAVVYNDAIYVLGGRSAGNALLSSLERYDPFAAAWDTTTIPPFTIPRVNAAAVMLNSRLFLVGGQLADSSVSAAVEVYDFGTGNWSVLPSIGYPRREHMAAIINNTVCVLGGRQADGDFVETIEYFNSGNLSWQEAPSTMVAPRAAAFYQAIDGVFYMFGGLNPFPANLNYQGDIDGGFNFTWNSLPFFSRGRGNGASAVISDRFFMFGGEDPDGVTDTVTVYDIITQSLSPSDALPSPRAGTAAVTLNDRMFLIGGYDAAGTPLDLVESYGPELTAIETTDPPAPAAFTLMRGYPNPFNGAVTLAVHLPARRAVRLRIFDTAGRLVRSVHCGTLTAGDHQFRWNGENNRQQPVGSGVYFALLQGPQTHYSLKLVYIR